MGRRPYANYIYIYIAKIEDSTSQIFIEEVGVVDAYHEYSKISNHDHTVLWYNKYSYTNLRLNYVVAIDYLLV